MAPQQVVMTNRAAVNPPLPPGFRFCPTDEELVLHYLRRRALGAPVPSAAGIPEVRILAHEPYDLLPPGWEEPERYFFSCKETKYDKGSRANRATPTGYWKATGKEKSVAVAIRGQAVLVGMKRSLVFYHGKPPTGSKTDWVMHEYRLAGAGLVPCRRAGGGEPARPAEGWVLCRVFRKKRSAAAAASAAARAAAGAEEEAEEEVVEEEEEEEEGDVFPASGFIDFFARENNGRQRRASSPVVSSSCLTDEQQQLQCKEPETTSRGA